MTIHKRHSLSLLTVLLLTLAVTLAACKGGGTPAPQGTGNYTNDYIKKICVTQPGRALAMLDTAEQKGYMHPIDINALRSMIYNNATMEYGKAADCAMKALRHPDISQYPDKEDRLLNMAASEYYSIGEYARCLRVADHGIDVAYKRGNTHLAAQLLLTVGLVHSEVGNMGHALESFDKSIAAFRSIAEKSPTWDTYYEYLTALGQQTSVLLDYKRYRELFALRPAYERAIGRIQDMQQGIVGADDVIYAAYYSVYAIAYEDTGDRDAGERMFDKLMQTRAAQGDQGGTFVVPYLLLRHRWTEALRRLDAEEKQFLATGHDSIDFYYSNTLLMNKARAYQALGQYKEAITCGMRAYALSDSLHVRMRNENAAWMSERFGNKMLALHIEKQKKQLRMSKTVIIGSTTALLILVLLMVRIVRDNRLIRRKNRAASQLISDLSSYKTQLYQLMGQRSESAGTDTTDDDVAEREAFLRVEKRIVDDRLFLRPKLTREEAADHVGISRARFSALFSRYVNGTFASYVNDLRLTYAAQLLMSRPNYSVEAIAQECGIPVRQTFYRLFSKKYGITPAEYRNAVSSGGEADAEE